MQRTASGKESTLANPNQMKDMEFFVDNHESPSDDDMKSEDEGNNQKNKKQKHHNQKAEIILLTSSSEKETERQIMAEVTVNKPSTKETSWGDMSDDDTVIQTNTDKSEGDEWQIATNKKPKQNKMKTMSSSINNKNPGNYEVGEKSGASKTLAPKIVNPYYKQNQPQGPQARYSKSKAASSTIQFGLLCGSSNRKTTIPQ